MVFAMFLLPAMIFLSMIVAYWPNFFNEGFNIMSLIVLIYLLYSVLILYIKWLNEELDIFVVTNMRLINLEQVSFMERTVSETNLSQIQDAKGVEKGVLGNLLHYGNLQIQTAAEKVAFTIKSVPDPFRHAREILDIRDKSINQSRHE